MQIQHLIPMKKLILTFLLLFSVVLSLSAQTNTNTAEFYSYLNTLLNNKEIKTIELLGTNYGTLNSKFNWEAKLKRKGKNIITEYISQTPNQDDSSSDLIVMHLDTIFKTRREKLIQNFKTETVAMASRPMYFDLTVTITVKIPISNKEFTLTQAEGLSFLLRYNKPFEEYYDVKSDIN